MNFIIIEKEKQVKRKMQWHRVEYTSISRTLKLSPLRVLDMPHKL